jgi:hypothetical protein
MRVFDFDPQDYAETYSAEEWVHIPEGVSEEFHQSLLAYAAQELESHVLDSFAIKGKKEQSLFEFPDGIDYPDELFDVVAAVCGLNRATMTLSERHIQMYEANAAPEPPAHKDRFPSQVSVGLSIEIPEASSLVLYPYDHRGINAFNKAADFSASLQPSERPEVVLASAREVELKDRPRDVVMFAGSTTWHLRRNAARALNLYLKFNDFGCDPLGEDPRTPRIREQTLAALATSNGHAELDELVPVVSPRFDSVSHVFLRNGQEALKADIYGVGAFGITERQLEVLRTVDGSTPMSALAASLANGRAEDDARDALLYLAREGAVDLLREPAPGS